MTAWRAVCGHCRHFIQTPLALESLLPGLSSLGSGFASVRADDGMCLVHERYVAASSACAHYQADEPPTLRPAARCEGA